MTSTMTYHSIQQASQKSQNFSSIQKIHLMKNCIRDKNHQAAEFCLSYFDFNNGGYSVLPAHVKNQDDNDQEFYNLKLDSTERIMNMLYSDTVPMEADDSDVEDEELTDL